NYKGKTITLIAHADGYTTKREAVTIPLDDATVNIYLQKIPDSVSVRGLVKDEKGAPVKNAELVFADGKFKTTSDNYGNFSIGLPYKDGEEVTLRVYTTGKLRYDNLVTISGISLTVQLQ